MYWLRCSRLDLCFPCPEPKFSVPGALTKVQASGIHLMQGWEFALSLIHSSLFALSLTIAHFKERPWALIALYKRATMSDSLPSLFSLQKSDRSDLLFFKSTSLFRSQKTSDSLKKPMSEFPTLLNCQCVIIGHCGINPILLY